MLISQSSSCVCLFIICTVDSHIKDKLKKCNIKFFFLWFVFFSDDIIIIIIIMVIFKCYFSGELIALS